MGLFCQICAYISFIWDELFHISKIKDIIRGEQLQKGADIETSFIFQEYGHGRCIRPRTANEKEKKKKQEKERCCKREMMMMMIK